MLKISKAFIHICSKIQDFANYSLLFAFLFEQFDVAQSVFIAKHRHLQIGYNKGVKQAVYEKI